MHSNFQMEGWRWRVASICCQILTTNFRGNDPWVIFLCVGRLFGCPPPHKAQGGSCGRVMNTSMMEKSVVAWCSVIGQRQSVKLSPDLYFLLLLIVEDISIHGATPPSVCFFAASFSFSSHSFIIRNLRRLFQAFVLHFVLQFTFDISHLIFL